MYQKELFCSHTHKKKRGTFQYPASKGIWRNPQRTE